MRREVALLLLALLTCSAAPPEPAEYRTEAYRAPVPETLKGATVLGTESAAELWRKQSAVFVDVLPRPPRPPNLPPGTIWRDKPRLDIPGSIWLPDTGYGALAPVIEDYFQHGLDEASHGDQRKLLVFYCLADCWMSWNAAKRALALGYTNVAWYREGTDGWEKRGCR